MFRFNTIVFCMLFYYFCSAQQVVKTMLRLPDTGQKMGYTNTLEKTMIIVLTHPFILIISNTLTFKYLLG
jgi:hypothetical protein